ncbi:phage tail tape measure protein [Variovorax sp. PAMC 28711]|uniref:phage tail tape measure protein n=1 Tax=Variovorax sp. PAMC 28711 TaxID=1795631 RepID=UPI00078C9F93|nr:phage tail tape measure protein [Variovorax sp. PAMC 28711]AMM23162.1 hypothetical protein AX767_01325 [Variovorax sp. PAMC 28711]
MAVGQLVVKLGLDAAEYTRGLSKAEVDARRFGEAIGENIRTAALVSTGAIVALGGAAIAASAAFNKLLEGAGKFQDLAEMTGDTAANLASFATIADGAGISVESIAGAMNKLTKNLVGVDDESKAAGAALQAIGISLDDFKKLGAADQFEKVGNSLNGFADGTEKVAIAMALFGKSGAEQLRVFKELEAEGGRTNILTAEQIKLADDYLDKQAVLQSQLKQYASAIATDLLPAINALSEVLVTAAKEFLNVQQAATSLGNSTGVQSFAEATGRALAGMIDYVTQSARELKAIVDFVGTAGEIIGKAASFDLSGARKAGADFRERYGLDENGMGKAGQAAAKTFVQSYNETLAASKRAAFNATDPRRVDLVNGKPPEKPKINFSGAVKAGGKGKTDNSAAQEAKAQLASDLDAIKNAQEAVTNQYANQEKILEALRSAGLKDETQYYAEKQRLLAQTSTAQEDALQKQIARLQQENLSGKDAIDNNKKIADAQAKLTKVQEDATTQAQILGIQQTAAYSKIKGAILSAQQAAQDFFDTTNRGYERELAGLGKGNKSRGLDQGITQIEDKYRQQRQDLQNQRAQAELSGTFTPDAAKQFDAQLGIINEFQAKALSSYKAYYASLDAASKDWATGAAEALQNYADESANTAKQMESLVGSAFKGLEDSLVEFVTTGKLNFKGLVDSILKDVARIVIKQQITGPLASLLGGQLGGGGSDPLGELLKSTGNVGSSASSGGLLSSLFSLFGKASGGNVAPGQMVRVNENGPELLDYQGKQYLMNGGRNTQITANHKAGGGTVVSINQSFASGTDRGTTDQAALAASRAIQRAQRNA